MSSDRPDELALDADVLMNLLATDRLEEILAASGLRGVVCPRTMAETVYLNPRTPGAIRETIDLTPHIAAGSIVTTTLSDDETATYVRFAAEVDDGEAQVLAVGLHRGLVVGTDDRRARRVAAREAVPLLSTPELILEWAQRSGRSANELREAVLDIEVRARYRPRPADADRPGWDRLRDG
jgi:predicted nucleic acid-binding protein